MKQNESQGCLNTIITKGPTLWPLAGEGGCSVEGAKRDKLSNKNHPKNHQHISYNLYFQKKKKK